MEKTVAQLTKDDVLRSYSGRPGCMCGCLGQYRYNPRHEAEARANRMSGHIDPEEFSSRSVSIVLTKLQRMFVEGSAEGNVRQFVDPESRWVSIQDASHSYTV